MLKNKSPLALPLLRPNNRIFTSSLRRLLKVLSLWEPNHQGKLSLEVSAYSPSDKQHCFPFGLDFEELTQYRLEEDLRRSPSLVEFRHQMLSDDITKWTRIPLHQIHPSIGHIQRLQGTPLELHKCPTLPKAPIVESFCIRHHFYRGTALHTLARLFRESLTDVAFFRFERWMAIKFKQEADFFDDLQKYLVPAFPQSLKRFYFNQWAKWGRGCHSIIQGGDIRTSITKAMVASCSHLTEICPPWQVITHQFLNELCIAKTRPAEEPKLELLCLESKVLVPSRNFTPMLLLASKAAWSMPRLRVLELWNAGSEFGFIFRCNLDPNRVTITWRSSRGGDPLAAEVVKAWNTVVSERALHLEVKTESFKEATKKDNLLDGKSIYHHLELSRLAIDPVTLARFEAERPLKEAVQLY
ncbi:hypothetical protein AK830_g11773 [Neonectria ditissima]|uniref:DUF6546 domain-containing protein n=1 Tax=Neonectria ditissima TaxID=78410 RepID=A0A0P7AC62_9HYPO|nr:hypothetical protein AK830_g11773 [Neonectria ditissima]